MSHRAEAAYAAKRAIATQRAAARRAENATSFSKRFDVAQTRPKTFAAKMAWFREEWEAEIPRRIHERGVEPDSQLGSPALAGGMRARMDALDHPGAAKATDYDRAKDTWAKGAAQRYPMLAALERLRSGSKHRKPYPFAARVLTRLAYLGFDYRMVAAHEGHPEEQAELYVSACLDRLWQIWSGAETETVRGLDTTA